MIFTNGKIVSNKNYYETFYAGSHIYFAYVVDVNVRTFGWCLTWLQSEKNRNTRDGGYCTNGVYKKDNIHLYIIILYNKIYCKQMLRHHCMKGSHCRWSFETTNP